MTEDETPPPASSESAVPKAPQEVALEMQAVEPPIASVGPEAVPTQQSAEPAPTPAPEPTSSEEPPATMVEQLPPVPSPTPTGQTPPVSPSVQTPANIVQELLVKARAKIQARKRKKLDAIVEEIDKSSTISNGKVQRLLRISKPTATRYLSILEKEGRIKQIGSRGRSVLYKKT